MEKGNHSEVSLIFCIKLCLKASAGNYIVWNKRPRGMDQLKGQRATQDFQQTYSAEKGKNVRPGPTKIEVAWLTAKFSNEITDS